MTVAIVPISEPDVLSAAWRTPLTVDRKQVRRRGLSALFISRIEKLQQFQARGLYVLIVIESGDSLSALH